MFLTLNHICPNRCDNQGPTFFSDSKLFLVLNSFFALVGFFLAGVLNDTKVGSKLTRCTASAHWCFGLQKNQNFNLFVGFIISFRLAMSYV